MKSAMMYGAEDLSPCIACADDVVVQGPMKASEGSCQADQKRLSVRFNQKAMLVDGVGEYAKHESVSEAVAGFLERGDCFLHGLELCFLVDKVGFQDER